MIQGFHIGDTDAVTQLMHPPLIISLTSSTYFGGGFYIRRCYVARTPRGPRPFIISVIIDEHQTVLVARVQDRT
jgi:hypothetical protein